MFVGVIIVFFMGICIGSRLSYIFYKKKLNAMQIKCDTTLIDYKALLSAEYRESLIPTLDSPPKLYIIQGGLSDF